MRDIIVIGAGIGGMTAAGLLAKRGFDVLLLEKIHHVGGTGYVFRRGAFQFPAGPLGFTHPDLVREILNEIGISAEFEFRRSHYQFISPALDIVYSRPFGVIKSRLKKAFPEESGGIDRFFAMMTSLGKSAFLLHGKISGGGKTGRPDRIRPMVFSNRRCYPPCSPPDMAGIPSGEILETLISDGNLLRFLGSQGSHEPEMSMGLLTAMWRFMCRLGIWTPSCGVDGIMDMIKQALINHGGEVRLNSPVARLVVEKNRVSAVETVDGSVFRAGWVVCNADFKRTFLEFMDPADLPAGFRRQVKRTPYSGSEFCVYLGVNPERLDVSRCAAQHVFFRRDNRPDSGHRMDDFGNRDIEVYLLSRDDPRAAPAGKSAIMLRVGASYRAFSGWKTGEKQRRQGYRAFKTALAEKLIRVVEALIPGLSDSIETMEVATPLSYEDWGQRFQGSIAGWSWNALDNQAVSPRLLIETPIENLLMVGAYAATDLFLGGIPTSIYTARLAADQIPGH